MKSAYFLSLDFGGVARNSLFVRVSGGVANAKRFEADFGVRGEFSGDARVPHKDCVSFRPPRRNNEATACSRATSIQPESSSSDFGLSLSLPLYSSPATPGVRYGVAAFFLEELFGVTLAACGVCSIFESYK